MHHKNVALVRFGEFLVGKVVAVFVGIQSNRLAVFIDVSGGIVRAFGYYVVGEGIVYKRKVGVIVVVYRGVRVGIGNVALAHSVVIDVLLVVVVVVGVEVIVVLQPVRKIVGRNGIPAARARVDDSVHRIVRLTGG